MSVNPTQGNEGPEEFGRRFAERLSGKIEQLIEDVLDFTGIAGDPSKPGGRARSGRARLDLWEDEANLYVECEVPGAQLADLDVAVEERTLTVRRTDDTAARPGGTVHRSERRAGPFERSIGLPCEVDVERTGAELKNGVLRVTMPKAASQRARRVEVRGGD